MKALITIALLLCAQWTFAQTPYEKAMNQALEQWSAGNTTQASAMFERIANAERENWIPKYYQALTLITASFTKADPEEKNTLLNKVNSIIPADEKELNSEWYVLKAMCLTSEMISDPMNLAMKLSPTIIANYQKATAIDPTNPRAIYGLAEFNIQSKKFMGGSTEQECKDLQKALSLFATAKKDILFHPNWGKERVEALVAQCSATK